MKILEIFYFVPLHLAIHFTYIGTEEEQNKVLLCKRSNTYLDTSKLQKLFRNVKNVKDAIKECLIKYNGE